MSVIVLNCNGCGASLSASSAARFITCTACGLSLEVHHRENSAWTEQAEDLREEVAALRAEQEVARLDREWDRKNDRLCFLFGRRSIPSRAQGRLSIGAGIFLAICLGGFALTVNVPPEIPGWFWLPLFILPVGCIVMGRFELDRASRYEAARRDYERRRRRARAAAGGAA